MTKRTDLHDVLDGLIFPSEKVGGEVDLSHLSLFELEAIMGAQQKVADIPGAAGNPIPKGNLSPETIKKLKDMFHAPVHVGGLKPRLKVGSVVEYTGQVNNGIARAPEWPRAALGVDSAGRRAAPEERREQEKVVTPDVQHVQPQSDGGEFVTKGAHDEKLLALFEGSAKKSSLDAVGAALGRPF